MSAQERRHLALGVYRLQERVVESAVRLSSIVGSWHAEGLLAVSVRIDHSVPGVQSLDVAWAYEADRRTDVAEALASLVSPLRVAHDRVAAAKRRIASTSTWPRTEHPWPLVRALDNLQKHQEAPPLYWSVPATRVSVYTEDRKHKVGEMRSKPRTLPSEDRYRAVDYLRVVDVIPKAFRGPQFMYKIEDLAPELTIGKTKEHPFEYPLRETVELMMHAALPLLLEAEGPDPNANA